MPVPLAVGYSFSNSESRWDESQISNEEETVRRVTIRQLWNAVRTSEKHHTQCTLDGVNLKKIILIANLQHSWLAPSEWHILDDGTGRIKAFIGKNKDPTYVYDKFEYVRVVGTLEFGVRGEKRSLSVFNMAPVHDPYEVYYHINHAMVDTMICERGSPPYNLIPDTHGQDIESLSQAFQNTSFSDVTEPHMSQQSVQEPNRQYDRVPFRSLLERDIIALIDNANLVYLEDLVMFIRQSCPTVDSAALKEAIQYLLSENLIEAGEDSGRDYFQLGERLTGLEGID